jgi:FixJ family two-component response regulator
MTRAPDAPHRILVVDDDEAVRVAMLNLLTSAGYAPEGFGDGAALLAAADPGLAHCAVLDIHLGDGDGFTLGERLRASAPQLPLIFITGDEDPRLDERARRAGALVLMRKPVDADGLLALIDALPPVKLPL